MANNNNNDDDDDENDNHNNNYSIIMPSATNSRTHMVVAHDTRDNNNNHHHDNVPTDTLHNDALAQIVSRCSAQDRHHCLHGNCSTVGHVLGILLFCETG